MKIYVLKGLKKKINLLIRLIIILSLLILLISKLFEIFSSDFFKDKKPSGNPLRVYTERRINDDNC